MGARLYLVILSLAVVETAWALVCALTSANLGLFYVGLVAASFVFFLPSVTGEGPARG